MIALLLTSALATAPTATVMEATGYSEERITKILMECSNRYLQGEALFLGKSEQQDKKIRQHYPKDSEVTETEKASRLLEFTQCQEISKNIKYFIKG